MTTWEYTSPYANKLYTKVATRLREREDGDRHERWQLNLVLLYVDKGDGSQEYLFDRFGLESMMLPLSPEGLRDLKSTEINRAVNRLVAESEHLLARGRDLLGAVDEEVNNRQNKTCLLLPKRNFGGDLGRVLACVRYAAIHGLNVDEFKNCLARVADSLPRDGKGDFKGKGELVFRAPSNAGVRHGLAPSWRRGAHLDSCVIRGRVRFGAPYAPNFHYDCALSVDSSRRFESCHGTHTLPRGRRHANIAPNDNVR